MKDISIEFLTLPVTVGYTLKINKFALGVRAGGYFGLARMPGSSCILYMDNGDGNGSDIFRSTIYSYMGSPETVPTTIFIKRSSPVDAGFAFGASISYWKFKLRADYQLGLNKTIFDMAAPRTFALSLAYEIDLKRKK